jgi:MFS-type transporter involved in bile tolerance (Atg22 family)
MLAALGYGSMGIIEDPLGDIMLPVAMLLGVGQMAVMQSSQTLIGQEAPSDRRGAVMGMFSICGAAGIMFITKVGGIAFDVWKPAPFVSVAVVNSLIFIAALVIRSSDRAVNKP